MIRKNHFCFTFETMKMNLTAEKNSIIRQFKMINDPELIEAIKKILSYGMKKEKEISAYEIPESHKRIVRKRIKETRKEDMIPYEVAMKKYSLK